MIERVVNFVNYVQNFDVNLMYTGAGDISILLANVSIIKQTSHLKFIPENIVVHIFSK